MPWPKGKPRPDNIAKMNAAWRPRPRIRPEKGTNAWRLFRFERPDGTVGKSPGCGTALLSAGPQGRAVLMRAGRLGMVLQPNAASNERDASTPTKFDKEAA